MAKNYNKGKVIGMNQGMKRDKPGLNAQVNIKPEDLKDIACENCGCKYFIRLKLYSNKYVVIQFLIKVLSSFFKKFIV